MNSVDPTILIVKAIYYIAVVGLSFFSIFAIYTLMRYGRNKVLGMSVCILYALFFLTILQQSYVALQSLS